MRKSVNQKELFSLDHTIYWPDRYEAVVEYLKNGTANKENPNSLYKLNVHIIVMAACLGLKSGERMRLPEKEKRKEIPLSVFNNHDLSIYIYIIALLSDPNPDISLLRNDEGEFNAIKIFEEYVAGGLQILSEKHESGFIDAPFQFVSDLLKFDLITSDLPPEEEIRLF